jgi:hydroxymethylpyrimidine pyrophosphatase-like HAD family hydrolase
MPPAPSRRRAAGSPCRRRRRGVPVRLSEVNKGTAIVELLSRLGIDQRDTIGIGDSSNDIEMLQVCAAGIAMGNADRTVKDVAEEVTTDVFDDGVWNASRRHGLI